MTGTDFFNKFNQSLKDARVAALLGLTKQASDKAYSEHMELCTTFANELCIELDNLIDEKTTNLTASLIAYILRKYADACEKCTDDIGVLLATEFAIEVPLKLCITQKKGGI